MATKIKKLLQCEWIIACAASSIDKDSNTLSIANIIDELTLTLNDGQKLPDDPRQSPPIPIPLDILVLFERERGVEGAISLPISVQLIDPTGAILVNMNSEVNLEPQHKRFRARFKLNAVPFTGFGEYRLQAISGAPEKTGGKELCDTSLTMKVG